MHSRHLFWFVGLLGFSALASELPLECGRLANHYGPFDYRKVPAGDFRIVVVERAHFPPEVESLKKGSTAHYPSGDISYTLSVFPNHPRALMAMMNWGLMQRTDKPIGTRYSVSCWFERGLAYAADDSRVPMIYGIYRYRLKQYDEAIKLFESSLKLGNEGTDAYYNLGLAYFAVQRYEDALKQAHIAYERGFALPGLRQMLQKVGKWQDPQPRANEGPKPVNPESVPPGVGEARPSGASQEAADKKD